VTGAAEDIFAGGDATAERLFDEHLAELEAAAAAAGALKAQTAALCRDAVETLRAGGKVLICGNGGSAANAQHMAAELSIRYLRDRRALPGIALSADTSAVTAAGNDFGFDAVFARQVEALGVAGDMLVGFTTSGVSPNVIEALKTARERGLKTVCITGRDGGPIAAENLADHCLIAPGVSTARIQEIHLLVTHVVCDAIDLAFAGDV
jgi:D-sedoheptulose 7-phosphate isomerase